MSTKTPPNIDNLKRSFTGQIVLPGDATYGVDSRVFMRTGHPAIITKPLIAADVAAAIAYAKEHELLISVKSGGHSGAGLSTNDDGMVIDLANMHTVELVDPEQRIVRIGAGAQWYDAAVILKDYGLAISSGDTKSVGIGGLTLGGGIGWMVRKYGLAIDNLLSAEVVTADGQILTASADENADLFWAIRGGGGNMGVVTQFTFKAQPVSTVFAGGITYKPEDVAIVLKGWRDYMRTAPEELTTMFLTMPSFGPDMPASVIVLACWCGDKDAAEAVLQPLRTLAEVMDDNITEKPYCDVLDDAHPPEGMRVIVHNTFIKELTDEAIAVIVENYQQHNSIYQIRSVGGAMNRVAADATAFAHRDSEAFIVAPTFIPPGATDVAIAAAIAPWNKIASFGKGSYVNFISEFQPEEIMDAYPTPTYERLAAVKQTYDPQNIFNQNANIQPSAKKR